MSASPSPRLASLIASIEWNRARLKTYLHAEDLKPAHWHYQAWEGGASIYWLVGHIVWTCDHTFGPPIGADSILPDDWGALFAFSTKSVGPAAMAEDYAGPSASALVDAWDALAARDAARLAELTDEELDVALPPNWRIVQFFPTIADIVLKGIFAHTAYHAGQITFLRRMQGLPGGLGR